MFKIIPMCGIFARSHWSVNVDTFELTVSSPENFQNGAEVVLSVGDLLDQDDSESGHSSDSSVAEPSERQVVHVPGSPSTPRTPRTETMNTIAQSPFSESDSINVEALMSGDIEEDNFKNNLKGKNLE